MKLNYESVSEFAISLLKQASFDDLMENTARSVKRILEVDNVALYFVRGDSELQLVAEAGDHLPEEDLSLTPVMIPFGTGITGSTAALGQPELIPDTRLDSRHTQDRRASLSMISVPIRFEGNLLAVIDCGSRQANAFTQADIEDLIRLAEIAAPRFDSARQQQNEIQAQSKKVESLSVFVGGIAHDFNNHLLALISNLNAAWAVAPRNIRQYLDFSIQACEKSQGLALQLQAFAKGAETQMELTELEPLVRESARLALTTRGSRYEIEVQDKLARALIDRSQIEQVVSNLLINADQASCGGGRIFIRLSNQAMPDAPERPAIRIQIQDFGCGIPDEQLNQIFQPYFTTKSDGTGLGLATSYFILQRHQGKIKVHSQVDQGTTFDVYLPISPLDPTSVLQMTDSSSQSSPNDTLKVMFVDDEESVRIGIAAFLSSLGYLPVLAGSGKEAIYAFNDALHSEHPISAVIIDMNVPDGDGATVLMHLRKLDPKIPAVITSGNWNSPVMNSPETYGFAGVLPKPFSMEQLQQEVQRALDSKDY